MAVHTLLCMHACPLSFIDPGPSTVICWTRKRKQMYIHVFSEFKSMHHTIISLIPTIMYTHAMPIPTIMYTHAMPIPTIMYTHAMPKQKYSLSTYVEGMAVLYQLVTYGSQKGTPYNDNHTSPRSSSSRCPFRRIPGQQQYQCLYIMKKGKYETFMITAVVVILHSSAISLSKNESKSY